MRAAPSFRHRPRRRLLPLSRRQSCAPRTRLPAGPRRVSKTDSLVLRGEVGRMPCCRKSSTAATHCDIGRPQACTGYREIASAVGDDQILEWRTISGHIQVSGDVARTEPHLNPLPVERRRTRRLAGVEPTRRHRSGDEYHFKLELGPAPAAVIPSRELVENTVRMILRRGRQKKREEQHEPGITHHVSSYL